jgi:hypothetical protein
LEPGVSAPVATAAVSAIEAAVACNSDAATDTCLTTVTDLCCAYLANTQGNGVAEAEAAYQAARAAGCSQKCPVSCPAANPMLGHCSPTGSSGRCGG